MPMSRQVVEKRERVANSAIVFPSLNQVHKIGSKRRKFCALEKTIDYARSRGLLIINDAKRGDIGSTSMAYAKAFLGKGTISGDMVTVNPFLGSDGYLPFVEVAKENRKGLFLLLKASNPSSHEIQDLKLENGELLYHKLAEEINELAIQTRGVNDYSFYWHCCWCDIS